MTAYTEQIVKMESSPVLTALKVMLWVGDILLTLVLAIGGLMLYGILMGTVTMIAFALAFILNYFSLFLWRKLNIEFEYLRTDNFLDIDKIYGQRDRQRVISIDLKNVEEFGVFNPEERLTADKIFMLGNISQNPYYLVIHTQKYGKTLVVFSPDQNTLDGLKFYLPRGLR